MDTAHGFDDEGAVAIDATGDEAGESGVGEPLFDLGGDERRMHVRAYNHWVSLLKGRPYPAIDDLDPGGIADFGPHGVLLDFTDGVENPRIAYLGRTLREECGLEGFADRIADVPPRSLLSRLTDHYLQIIANRAPIGFEAEFVSTRGRTTLYRGILMPFSSGGEGIDFIYGVINWKEMVDADTQASLDAELDAAVRSAPKPIAEAPVWADGPGAGLDGEATAPAAAVPTTATEDEGGSLADRLMMARESAAAVRAADTRGRAALYRALGRAHDFALATETDAAGYAALLDAAAIKVQPRAPLTPLVKLVFGADYDKTRLAEYAVVLAAAGRHRVRAGGLGDFIDAADGGIKAIVAAERAARKPAALPDPYQRAAAELRALPVLASVPIDAGAGEFVVLVARAGPAGALDVVARIDAPAFVAGAVRRAA